MNKAANRFEAIAVGDEADFSKTVTESDIYLFAGITGDFNPVHVNKVYAAQTIFEGPVAHGMLSAGFISTVLGNALPGPGTVYLSQTLEFKAPVRINDTIIARVKVLEKIVKKKQLRLETVCRNQNDEVVIKGEARVLLLE
ncbi:MAG: MaoC family dehydratase [Thermodesulfobacteriota bacterium]|nr:MaoC family dehydratase [Thermodesulfobacteriota bacterium]